MEQYLELLVRAGGPNPEEVNLAASEFSLSGISPDYPNAIGP